VEDYYSGNSSAPLPRKAVFSQSKIELSRTVIVPPMMIGAVNFEEELASMKATLERLSKESTEKDTRIKLQEEHIAKLIKKTGKKGHVHRLTKAQVVMKTKKDLIEVKLLRKTVG